MPLYGTIDSLVEYTPLSASSYFQVQAPDEDSKLDGLENLLADKVKCLGDILADIERDMARRADLSQYVVYLISQHYCYLKTKLFELYTWQLGSNRSIEVRRIRLEQQLDTLNNERRQELVTAWQDVAALKKEFRTWFKQYCDLAQRVRLVAANWLGAGRPQSEDFRFQDSARWPSSRKPSLPGQQGHTRQFSIEAHQRR